MYMIHRTIIRLKRMDARLIFCYHEFPSRIEYHLNGKLHRVDGPALEYGHGPKMWFLDGTFHRTDGPAVEYPGMLKEWWFKCKRHRLDGPAILNEDGEGEWWVCGKKHRLDGPSEFYDNESSWWVNDKRVSKEEVDKLRCEIFLKSTVINIKSKKYL